jgi:transposase
MNDTLDRIRQSEHFELSKRRDNALARTRQMWLWGQENLPEKYQDRFALLKREDLRTARAWAIKEHLRRLWQQPDVAAAARAFFDHWHQWVKGCGMTPLIRLPRPSPARSSRSSITAGILSPPPAVKGSTARLRP